MYGTSDAWYKADSTGTCRSLYSFVQQSSYNDCRNRKDFLERVVGGCSQFRELLGHDAFTSTCCQSEASSACHSVCSCLDLVLIAKQLLPWFEVLLKHELQGQAELLQAEVDKNSDRGCGWALQREHALPVVECRHSLPAMVQALSQAQMCSSHIVQYDVVLQWVGALWSSYFSFPKHLLFEHQSDSAAITLPHMYQLENQLRVYEASCALRKCSDTLTQLEAELAHHSFQSQVH